MLKKTLTYTNFNDEKVTETFYFNFTKADLVEFAAVRGEGFETYIRKIQAAKDNAAIMKTFKEIVGMTVGERSEDGNQFVKSPEITAKFMNSAAFSEFFLDLCTNARAASEFIRAVMPKDMVDKVDTRELDSLITKEDVASVDAVMAQYAPSSETTSSGSMELAPGNFVEVMKMADGTHRAISSQDNPEIPIRQGFDPTKTAEEYTHQELVEMPKEHFEFLFGDNPQKWSKRVLAIAYQRKTS